MRIYDKNGQEQTLTWLYHNFGPLEVLDPTDTPSYIVTELRVNDDPDPGSNPTPPHLIARPRRILAPSSTFCLVLDEDGAPLPGIQTVFWYDTAPTLPGAGWHEQGDVGLTKDDGYASFAMGGGAYYDPSSTKGPHDLWIYGPNTSQMISGLGMIAGTNHRHLDVTFQRQDPNMPPYEDPDLPAAVRAICQGQALLRAARKSQDAALRRLEEALVYLRRTCEQ